MNEEALEHIHDALQELDHISFEDVPVHLQDDFSEIKKDLTMLSIELDN